MEKKAFTLKFEYQKRVIAYEEDFDNEEFVKIVFTDKDAAEMLNNTEKYLIEKVVDESEPYGSLVSDFRYAEEVEAVFGRMKGLKGFVLISPDPSIDAYVKVRLEDERGEEIVAYFEPGELKILK